MPTWGIHIAIADKLLEKINVEKQPFIFGNIMPDILVGHVINKVSQNVPYSISHFTDKENINGINASMPGVEKFKTQYKDYLENPVLLGCLCHLITDYCWNKNTYINHFEQYDKEKNIIKVRLNGNKEKILPWDDAVKIKHKDFNTFTESISKDIKICDFENADKIYKYCTDVKQIPLLVSDVKNAIDFMENMNKQDNIKMKEYEMLTRNELEEILDKSIDSILENI